MANCVWKHSMSPTYCTVCGFRYAPPVPRIPPEFTNCGTYRHVCQVNPDAIRKHVGYVLEAADQETRNRVVNLKREELVLLKIPPQEERLEICRTCERLGPYGCVECNAGCGNVVGKWRIRLKEGNCPRFRLAGHATSAGV